MEISKCTFFGHRDAPPGVKSSLRQVISELIEQQGVKQFYVGNQGSFDAMARSLSAYHNAFAANSKKKHGA